VEELNQRVREQEQELRKKEKTVMVKGVVDT